METIAIGLSLGFPLATVSPLGWAGFGLMALISILCFLSALRNAVPKPRPQHQNTSTRYARVSLGPDDW